MPLTMIEIPSFSPVSTGKVLRDKRLDYDVREIAVGFGGGQACSLASIEYGEHGTNTFGDITFQRVDPLREPIRVADTRLQSRLEALCETLRAKY